MAYLKSKQTSKGRKRLLYEINWKLVSDGLIAFKSTGVFLTVLSAAGLGLWERGSLPMILVGFGSPDAPRFQTRQLKCVQEQPTHSTTLQRTSNLQQGETDQGVTHSHDNY